MSDQINVKSASVPALQKAWGESIQQHVKEWGSIKGFVEHSGVSKATLYRVFNGLTVGSDVILKLYQALGQTDVLTLLIAAPKPSPMLMISKPKSRAATVTERLKKRASTKAGFSLSGIADPHKLRLSNAVINRHSLASSENGTKQLVKPLKPEDSKW